jgi:hypothetical protein
LTRGAEIAFAKAYIEPWQRTRKLRLSHGRGTSGLPPVAWEHIIGYVSAIAPKELRGVTAVARDLASASATCTDMYCAVLGRWQLLAQFCTDQQLPLKHSEMPQQVDWQRLLAAPLKQSVSELQSALKALQLSTDGTKPVLARRVLEHFKLRWPVAVPLTLVWAVRAECSQSAPGENHPGHDLVTRLGWHEDKAAWDARWCKKWADYSA